MQIVLVAEDEKVSKDSRTAAIICSIVTPIMSSEEARAIRENPQQKMEVHGACILGCVKRK